jgi:hypothetical protein
MSDDYSGLPEEEAEIGRPQRQMKLGRWRVSRVWLRVAAILALVAILVALRKGSWSLASILALAVVVFLRFARIGSLRPAFLRGYQEVRGRERANATILRWKLERVRVGDGEVPHSEDVGLAWIFRPDGGEEPVQGGRWITRADAQRIAADSGYELELEDGLE